MKRSRIGVAALLAILAAILVVGVAWAKNPCSKGYDIWYHITGNGTPKCQCFKHDKPPKNPEWNKGCPPQGGDDDDNPAPPEDDPIPPGGDDTPFPTSGTDVAAITRLGNYDPTTNTIKVYTVGAVGSFRLKKQGERGATWLEVPDDWIAINVSEHRSTLYLGDLEPGTYFLFAHHWVSGNSGDDGERFVVP